MPRRSTLGRTVAVLLSLALAGCGAEKEPKPVTVKGKVQYAGGKPVANMVLIFHPLDDTRKRKVPSFVLDGEGRFQDAVLPGRYKATLAPLPTASGGGPAGGADAPSVKGPGAAVERGPLRRYQDREQSPWEIVIPESGKEDLLLTVQ